MRTARTAPATAFPPARVVARSAEVIAAPVAASTSADPAQGDGRDPPGRATALAPQGGGLPQLQALARVPARSTESEELARLNDAQRGAIAFARKTGRMNSMYLSRTKPPAVAASAGLSRAEFDLVCTRFVERGRVQIYFHPDKEVPGGGTMLDSISTRPALRNQFETKYSSCSYEADPAHSSRLGWEDKHFGGAYGRDPLIPEERPKYGIVALDGKTAHYLTRVYGDAYFVLKPSVHKRTTISNMDTSDWLSTVSTFSSCSSVLATARHFREIAGQCLDRPYEPCVRVGKRRPEATMADYTEAQVHGPIEYARDVEAVVAPARLLGTEHEPKMRAFCERNGIELRWDHGNDVIVPDGAQFASLALAVP